MNRRERRHAEKLARDRQARLDRMPPARADGRPQYYDIPPDGSVQCYFCVKAGLSGIRHKHGRAVVNDPANPPAGEPKGDIFTICVQHLPENAVIYNPKNNLCRTKAGDHTWEENPRQEIRSELDG